MSFKRDGNDTGLLSVLRKRRIKDLLAENIPEDEAKLLANGRFTCLVCSNNPIFDTVNMLSVHRKGNKHKANAEYQEKKKAELRNLIAKRKHDQFLSTGSTSIQMAIPQHTGLSSSSPYDSRVKRCKVKPGDRKLSIDLQASSGSRSHYQTTPPISSEAEGSVLTQSSSLWHRICEQQQHGPVKHDVQLNHLTRMKSQDPINLTPYNSKQRRVGPEITTNTGGKNSQSQPNKVENGKVITMPRETDTQRLLQTVSSSTSSVLAQTLLLSPPPPPPPPPPPQPSTLPSQECENNALQSKPTSQFQASLALKYHQLQGSGWKKDWDGKWIKDEEAEFDSDEEPPDLP